ncbi:MAG: FAD-binding protein [Myxococcota bacterium]|nr:FAD-binding protein [Myxococcota bacterium]
MAGLPASHRARRWDVLVLGGALPGLVAAIRLAREGARVLVAEEEGATRGLSILREPFLLPGPSSAGVLDACLEALGVGLRERRAFETRPLSHQVILPDARIDVGPGVRTAAEWVAWGLAKPEAARDLARGLEEAARAEIAAMLKSPVVRPPRRLARLKTPAAGAAAADPMRHLRGLPGELLEATPELAPVLAAELRALGDHAGAAPSPEARARLLGAALLGGGTFHEKGLGLRALLRERLQALHGEFRGLDAPFEFVRLGEHPGIARRGPGDAWLGRLVLVNAPPARLAAALESFDAPVPGFLKDAPAITHRRLKIHLRALREVVPEGMAERAILVGDPAEPDGPGTVALSWHASQRGTRYREAVARVVVPDEPDAWEDAAERVETALARLMPFSANRFKRAPLADPPLWDDEGALADPDPGSAWPAPAPLRAARDSVFVVPREAHAALGTEGDLLLGWRLGDALAELLR